MSLALALSLLIAARLPVDEGLDRPLHTSVTKGAPSEGIDGAFVRVRCAVYAEYALIEHDDPGLRGAARVVVRPRAKDAPLEQACTVQSKSERALSVEDAYVAGAHGPFVVLRGADGFGLAHRLVVVRADTGRTVVDLPATSAPARFETRDGVTRLATELVLSESCASGQACVDAARARGEISKEARIDVSARACRARADDGADLQVAVPARVEDLAKPRPLVVDGVARCAATP